VYLEELKRGYLSTLIQNKYFFRELVRCLKAMDVPVILFTAFGSIETAIQAIRRARANIQRRLEADVDPYQMMV